LAPTVGIATTEFCHPGGILQLFSSTKSANFAATDSSNSQIASSQSIFFDGLHHQKVRSDRPIDFRWLVSDKSWTNF
jgi:hypothetical protein